MLIWISIFVLFVGAYIMSDEDNDNNTPTSMPLV